MSKSKKEQRKAFKRPQSEHIRPAYPIENKVPEEETIGSTKKQDHEFILDFDFTTIGSDIINMEGKNQSLVVVQLMSKNNDIDHKFDGANESKQLGKKTAPKKTKMERSQSLPLSLSLWGNHKSSKGNNDTEETKEKDVNSTVINRAK